MEKYVVLDKKVGETPLVCAEAWRKAAGVDASIPLAYAGRLDPMASGKLLILIGDECKNQTNYHGLDKEYEFSVLFGIESDSLDVLGRLQTCTNSLAKALSDRALQAAKPSLTRPDSASLAPDDEEDTDQSENWVRLGLAPRSAQFSDSVIISIAKSFVGTIELPYPKFSSKTVQGKALHTWTLEGRLDEIEIPTKESEIYLLEFNKVETISRSDLVEQALAKVNSIPEVTDPRKVIGNDFRRIDVRKDWDNVLNNKKLSDEYQIAHFTCIASSGTYMRTLASVIANKIGTCGLAWHIHRTEIGEYGPQSQNWNFKY